VSVADKRTGKTFDSSHISLKHYQSRDDKPGFAKNRFLTKDQLQNFEKIEYSKDQTGRFVYNLS